MSCIPSQVCHTLKSDIVDENTVVRRPLNILMTGKIIKHGILNPHFTNIFKLCLVKLGLCERHEINTVEIAVKE